MAVLLPMLLAVPVSPAAAQARERDLADCRGAADQERSIQACSAIIAAGNGVSRESRAIAFNNRASIHVARGELDAALRDYDAALAIDPRYVNALVRRAAVHRDQARFAQALADLDTALRLQPNSVLALRLRADVRRIEGRQDAALADLDTALRLRPGDAGALADRGFVHLTRGNLGDAASDAAAVLAIDAADSGGLSLRCILRFREHRVAEGMADCDRAVAAGGAGASRPFVARAVLRVAAGALTPALADAEEALRRNVADAFALQTRSLIRRRMGSASGAALDAEAARALQPRVREQFAAVFGRIPGGAGRR